MNLKSIVFVCFFSIYGTACSLNKKIPVTSPSYTQDWFSPNIPNWEKYLSEYKGKPAVTYLEIGVFEGRSAFWVLNEILTGRDSKATLVDLFNYDFEKTFLNNLNLQPQKNKVRVIKGSSLTKLRELSPESFDIVYIDGSHTARDVFIDLANSWILLKVGGTMILDDYKWGENLPGILRPGNVIDVFLTSFSSDIQVIHKDYQIFLKKLPSVPDRHTKFGHLLYNWKLLAFVNSKGEIVYEPTVEEKEVLSQYFFSLRIGDTKPSAGEKVLKSNQFLSLLKKLSINETDL